MTVSVAKDSRTRLPIIRLVCSCGGLDRNFGAETTPVAIGTAAMAHAHPAATLTPQELREARR
jgi:hypothetical protein